MKKVIFLDRDGTIIDEPKIDQQVDDFNKLSFIPGVFKYLEKINNELGYDLVMVTNQDGLGTDSFPQETFWPIQNFIIDSFKNENINFIDIIIDNSFENQNLPSRKPGTLLVQRYMNDESIDLNSSFVIGDRETDLIFANNIGCSSIYFSNASSKIYSLSYCLHKEDKMYPSFSFFFELSTDIILVSIKTISNQSLDII